MLLIVGGLIAAAASIPPVFRGAGILTALAGAGLAYLSGRSRAGAARFRRAGIALSLTIVVLVAVVAAFGVVHILTLVSVLPLVIGTAIITRPAAAAFYEEKP